MNWTRRSGQGDASERDREDRREERGAGLTDKVGIDQRYLQGERSPATNFVGLRPNRRKREREAREECWGFYRRGLDGHLVHGDGAGVIAGVSNNSEKGGRRSQGRRL
jgi:hypothetical protein